MFFQKKEKEKNLPQIFFKKKAQEGNLTKISFKKTKNLPQIFFQKREKEENLPRNDNCQSPSRAGDNTSKIQFQAQPFTKQLLNKF